MQQAVYELSTVAPHEPKGARIGRDAWPFYCAGYYGALQASLRVMDLTVRRVNARRRQRRAETRQKKSA